MPNGANDTPEGVSTDFSASDLPNWRMRVMFEYWQEKRGIDPIPPTSEIDPLKFPQGVLPFLSVLDVVGCPARFRVRLKGTGVVDALGQDDTGKFLDEVGNLDRQIERCRWAIRAACPYLGHGLLTWSRNDFRRYCVLKLPFGEPDGTVTRLVGCFAFD